MRHGEARDGDEQSARRARDEQQAGDEQEVIETDPDVLDPEPRVLLRHGEAVAVGLIYAAEVARRLDRIDADRVQEHRDVVAHYELDHRLPRGADPDELVRLFWRDKKAVGGLTFVLDGDAGVETVKVDDESLLRDALEAIR